MGRRTGGRWGEGEAELDRRTPGLEARAQVHHRRQWKALQKAIGQTEMLAPGLTHALQCSDGHMEVITSLPMYVSLCVCSDVNETQLIMHQERLDPTWTRVVDRPCHSTRYFRSSFELKRVQFYTRNT